MTPTTVLITGSTDGLGRALAERLATQGTRLLLHGRDGAKLADVAGAVGSMGDEKPLTFMADFAQLADVWRLAAEVRDSVHELDVLVNSAGIGSGEPDGRERRVSADGYELRFAVNYLAGFLLTLELLPTLRAAGSARVVNVASLGQHPIDFDDLMIERGYSGKRAYGQSKLAQIMSGFELARRFPPSEISFNSLHPATFMPTKMVLQEVGHHVDSLEDGVASVERLVMSADLAGVSGKFYDRTRESTANDQAYDETARAELWRRSVDLVGHTGI
jgi:NAD(P)-dependent dehydrogenase (short-subunit alcohol dehydrogenase family)